MKTLILCGLLAAAVPALAETPQKITPCDLKATPSAHDHALVEVTGFVSHGFEDFSLFDPACLPWLDIWLEYGGTVRSGTMYCCGVTDDRSRPEPLEVEQIPVPLTDDDVFRRFDERIQHRGGTLAHATLVGRFFAGNQKGPGNFGRGYGHMGCCSLFVIQQVLAVDPEDRADVDYDPFPDQPDLKEVGCGYRELTDLLSFDEWIAAQHKAEADHPWAFDDPRRVASEALAQQTGARISPAALKETRRSQGRLVFEWRPKKKSPTYMVVVSRPYLVTFYARDSTRVAWIMTAAYESSCDRGRR